MKTVDEKVLVLKIQKIWKQNEKYSKQNTTTQKIYVYNTYLLRRKSKKESKQMRNLNYDRHLNISWHSTNMTNGGTVIEFFEGVWEKENFKKPLLKKLSKILSFEKPL